MTGRVTRQYHPPASGSDPDRLDSQGVPPHEMQRDPGGELRIPGMERNPALVPVTHHPDHVLEAEYFR